MNPKPSPHELAHDLAYPLLKEHVIGATGLAYYADKDTELARRLARRIETRGLAGCAAYLGLLQDGARGQDELDTLIEDLTIGETYFFRHREMFEALRDTVLPDVMARNRSTRQLRVWSAGCSTGAEAYTLSILLKRDLGQQLSGWNVSVLGTDINRDFLARAREGLYEPWALRNLPEEVLRSCFVAEGRAWRIAPTYKEGVSFAYHNLVTDVYPSLVNDLFAFDLILCRNVTIYFSLDIVQRILGHFHDCLVEGGWLLVGHSEPNVQMFRQFRTVNAPGAVLYQKPSGQPVSAPKSPQQPTAVPGAPGTGSGWASWVPPSLPVAPTTLPSRPVPAGPPVSRPVLPSSGTSPPRPVPARSPSASPGSTDVERIQVLANAGQWEQAVGLCEKAVAADRFNPVLYFYHGLVLEQLGRHREAEHALRRALYLDRQFALAHYYLGLLLQKQGQAVQAVRSSRNVLQLLAGADPARVLDWGDGITVAELEKLTRMNLDVLDPGGVG